MKDVHRDEGMRLDLSPRPTARRYRTPSRDMAIRVGFDVDKALALAAADEDVEILRKLALRSRNCST